MTDEGSKKQNDIKLHIIATIFFLLVTVLVTSIFVVVNGNKTSSAARNKSLQSKSALSSHGDLVDDSEYEYECTNDYLMLLVPGIEGEDPLYTLYLLNPYEDNKPILLAQTDYEEEDVIIFDALKRWKRIVSTCAGYDDGDDVMYLLGVMADEL